MLTTADVLAFEEHWGTHTGNKEEAIRHTFGETPARYYQVLARMIDTREALELNPLLVRRLRRIRDQRRAERENRRQAS